MDCRRFSVGHLFQPLCGWFIDVIGLEARLYDLRHPVLLPGIAHAGAGSHCTAILRFFMGGAGSRRHAGKRRQNYRRMVPEIGTSNRRWLAGRRLSIGAMLALLDYLFRPRLSGWQGRSCSPALALLWGRAVVGAYHNLKTPEPRLKSELAFIRQDNEPPAVFAVLHRVKTVSKKQAFYGIAIPAFMAEPARAVLSFCPLYL